MKPQLLLLAFITAVAFSSCTTAYKTGQTPDDVYFSPAQPQDEYVRVERKENRRYEGTDEYYDDRYLRMKVQNRYRWNDLNDWYSYDRYSYGFNYNYGTYYNPYNSWNYYYNPYCTNYSNYGYGYGNTKITPIQPVVKPHYINLGGYTNSNYNNTNSVFNNKSAARIGSGSTYNNTNSSSKGFGNTMRTIFNSNSNNNSSGNSNSSSSRTYTPSTTNNNSSSGNSSSSSGSSSSGGSSSGGVSRPVRN